MTTLQSDTAIRSEFGLAGSPQEFLSRRTTFANPLGEFYLDSFSLPTYDRPSTGTIFGNIADKITMSAGSTESFTGVQKAAARSVPEMVADYFQDRRENKVQIPGSFIQQGDEWVFATQQGTKPLASVRMADVWETIPELQRVAMQQAGFDTNVLTSIGVNTAEDFASRWPEILQSLKARERVAAYKQANPTASGVASGVEFVSQLADPTLLLTLGATAFLKTAASTAIKQGAKAAVKQSLRGAAREAVEASLTNTATRAATLDRMAVMASDGLLGGLSRAALANERSAAARMLLLPTGAAYGAGIATLGDVGAQYQSILTGAGDPSEGVEVRGGPALIGGLIGLAFGEFAYRMTGASLGPISNGVYLNNGPDNFAKFALEARRGFVYYGGQFEPRTGVDPRWLDSTVDIQQVSDLEFVESAITSLYNPDLVAEFSSVLPKVAPDPAKTQELADFLRGYPTPAELRQFMDWASGPKTTEAPPENIYINKVDPADPDVKHLQPLTNFSNRAYRETSPERALNFVPGGVSNNGTDDLFFSMTKDLAAGQGDNKGVLIELDTTGIRGQINTKKPLWEPALQNGQAEFIINKHSYNDLQKSVSSVTLKPGVYTQNARLKLFLDDLAKNQGWKREEFNDGSVTFRRPGKTAQVEAEKPTTTEFTTLSVQLADLEVRAREAASKGQIEVARSLRKEYAKAAERRAYLLTDQLALSPTAEVKLPEVQRYFLSNKFVAPITSIPDSGIRVQEIEKRLVNTIKAAGKETYTRSVIPYLRKGVNKIGADYRNPVGSLRAFMGSASDRARYIALEATGITNRGFVYNEVLRDANGVAIPNTYSIAQRFTADFYEPVSQMNHRVVKGLSAEDRDALWVSAWRHATNQQAATGHAAALGDAIRDSVDRLGKEGAASGYLPNLLKDFAPNYWKHDAPAESIQIFRTRYIEKRLAQYASEETTDIHFNTLVYMGYLKKQDGVFKPTDTAPPLSKKILDKDTGEVADLPTGIADLPDEVLGQYLAALPRAIELEADLVIHRRSAKSNNAGEIDPDEEFRYEDLRNPNQARIVNSFSLDGATRKLEQDILFDEQVLQSGLVDLDPSTVMMLYQQRTGFNIARQKALTARYGEFMPYKEYKQALERLAQGDEEAKAALEMYNTVEANISHRYKLDRQGLATTTVLSNVVAGTANMATPVAQMAFETPLTGALIAKSMTTGRRDFSVFTRDIAYAFKGLVDERRGRLDGFIKSFEQAPSRLITDMGRNLPLKVRNNRLVQGSKFYAEATRTLSGERFLTNFQRSLIYDRAYGKLWAFSKKLDKLRGLQRTFEDNATKAGAARAAGLSMSELDEFRFHGLLEDDMLDIAKELVEINPNALERRDTLRAAMLGLSEDRRGIASELDRRLWEMANRGTDAIIATPSPADRLVAENNIMRLLSAFTGWANAFQNQTISRLASSAYHEHVAFLGTFLAGEVAVGIMRDILYNGVSAEDAVAKWEEKPAENLALLVSRMPFFGAFNPVMLSLQGIAASQSNGIEDLTNAPALQMVGRVTRSLKNAATDVQNGDPVRDSVMRTVEKYAPGPNAWYTRLLDTYIREEFEGDSDR